jgi:hypothetical protein
MHSCRFTNLMSGMVTLNAGDVILCFGDGYFSQCIEIPARCIVFDAVCSIVMRRFWRNVGIN